MIDLSIIIVNWNTKALLIQCLTSVSQIIEALETEVIVVDNASRDGSGSAVKETFPFVDLIENDRNLGFAKAANQGLRRASGRYVLLLNPDTEVKRGAIEKLISFMDGNPKAGIAGAQLLNSDGSRQNSIANFPSLATELLNKRLLRWVSPKQFPGKEIRYSEPIEVDSVIGACMMVRREAMEQVGFLDENYVLFLEETDWCYWMKRAGWKIYHVPQAGVLHFQGKSAEQDKRRAKVEYYRSRYHFFEKTRGKGKKHILLTGLMIKLGFEFLSMMIACLLTGFSIKRWRKKFSTYTYLLWWHIKGCPKGMGLK